MSFEEYPLRFEVLSAVSSGGMGRVDVARLLDVEPEVLVAVKRPHMHMSNDEEFARMFMEEARLTWAIQHPNVARLVGWGRDDESIYMATEFVSGGPLHEIARRGRRQGDPMSAELVAYVIARASDGLAAAHGLTFEDGSPCNIVHRDISPSNIMVGFDGRVKIIDFGVAKIAQGSNALRTATGVLKGKVPYMAPEYARGGVVDVSCDLYSLGVVLYELLCGHRPFSAEHDLELLRKVVEDPPPSLLEAVPHLDPDLCAFVHQMLAKTKQERPASARSVSMVLDSYLLRHGRSQEEMQRELSQYVARYAQGRSLQTRSAVGPQGASAAAEPAGAANVDPRPHTRAVAPAAAEHNTRVSSDSGIAAASAGAGGERNFEGLPVGAAASTNSALLVPPTTPVKAPVYLWIAMATGLFSLVIALSALFLVSSRAAPEPVAVPPSAATAPGTDTPRTVLPVVASAVPVADPTAAPPQVSAAPPAATISAPPTSTTPPKTPPKSTGGSSPPVPAVPPGTRKPPSAGCTPMSFDYPRCLKK